MSHTTFLPVILPLVSGIVLLLATGHVRTQRVIASAATLIAYGASIFLFAGVWQGGKGDILVYRLGNWAPPFGIVLVADMLSSVMVVMSMTIATAALFFSFATLDRERERLFHPLFMFQIVGVNGSFLTGDIFNLFVFFEVMLISSYALLSLGGERRQLEATIKYVAINLFSSPFLLSTVGLLYGLMGTLNMADLAQKVSQAPDKGMITVLAMLFLVVFGIKSAVFPLFFWLPGAYTVVPSGTATYFGGILTKVGVYALVRVFTLIFNYDPGFTHTIILGIAGLTMFVGVLGAAAQKDIRTILSYHIISQIGYMVMGLGLFTVLSIAGTVFYIIHHIVVKSCLFLVAGATEKVAGTGELKHLGGLGRTHPYLGVLFLVVALSLAGFPPLSGFFAKVVLIRAGLEVQSYWVVAVALVVSLLTIFSMMKIWQGAFCGEAKGPYERSYRQLLPTIAFLAILTVAMGLLAGPMMQISLLTAEQIMHPEMYIHAVLAGGG